MTKIEDNTCRASRKYTFKDFLKISSVDINVKVYIEKLKSTKYISAFFLNKTEFITSAKENIKQDNIKISITNTINLYLTSVFFSGRILYIGSLRSFTLTNM